MLSGASRARERIVRGVDGQATRGHCFGKLSQTCANQDGIAASGHAERSRSVGALSEHPPVQSSTNHGHDWLWSALDAHSLVWRIETEQGGTVRAYGSQPLTGWVCSLTNNRVRDSVRDALASAITLLQLLARQNPQVSGTLVLGWWRDEHGTLFVDVGRILDSLEDAVSLARMFVQEAVVRLREGMFEEEVEVIAADAEVETAEGVGE